MSEIEGRLAELAARVESLEAQLAALANELERRQGDRSMKARHMCPACGCRRLLHAREIVDRTDSARTQLAVTAKGFWSPQPVGKFECHVCSACGLVEWQVPHPEEIPVDGETIFLIDGGAPPEGPYR